MTLRRFLAAVLGLALLLPAAIFAERQGPESKVVAYYFFSNYRCQSCLTIEKWTGETLRDQFGGFIDSGVLVWRPVNIDEEGNFHFVKDYQLLTKSVVLSRNVNGKELRWKNLEKVWELLRDEKKFRGYVKSEVQDFLVSR